MDEIIRRRERAAAQGGIEAGAGLLIERVRSGELSEGRVSLAAYLGDERAKIAIEKWGKPKQAEDESTADLQQWLRRILEMEGLSTPEKREALIRASIAIARKYALPILKQHMPDDSRPTQGINAIEKLVSVDLKDRESFVDACNESTEALANCEGDASNRYSVGGEVAGAAGYLVDVVNWGKGYNEDVESDFKEKNDDPDLMFIEPQPSGVVGESYLNYDDDEFYGVVKQALIPWVLKEGDPVKERVEAREAEE